MEKARAIVFTGHYRHNTGHIFAIQMATALAQHGMHVETVDLRDRNQCRIAREKEFYRNVALVLSINGYRPGRFHDGIPYLKELDCAFVTLLIHSPFERISAVFANNDLVLCRDRSHQQALLNYYFRMPAATAFMPPGGTAIPSPLSWEKRKNEIIHVSDYLDHNAEYRRLQTFPQHLRSFIDEAIEHATADLQIDAWTAMIKTLTSRKFDLSAESLIQEGLLMIFPILNRYLLARRRHEALDLLDKAGIAVQIWGDNWPGDLFKHHVTHQSRPWDEITRLIPRYQTLLDLSFMPDGSDERIAAAMINGVATITSANPYLRESFKPDQEIILFQTISELPERYRKLQENPEYRAELANAGMNAAMNKASWQVLSLQLLGLVEQLRALRRNQTSS